MRFLVMIVAVAGGLALLIGVARVIGQAQPAPDGLEQLHLTECALPCWLGITPGETPFDEALRRVKETYPTTPLIVSDSQIFIEALVGFEQGEGVIEARQGVVDSVMLTTVNVGELRLGDVVSMAGKPSCLQGNPPTAAIYSSRTAFAFLAGRNEGWQTSLTNITIQAAQVDYCRAGHS